MSHDFDLLKQWAEWDDDGIEKIISEETIGLLQRVVRLLADETTADSRIVTRDNFIQTVREMRHLYREGSWLLGEAIIEAGEFVDKRDYANARAIYERFLEKCRSKFYRGIAENQLKKLESGASNPS